MQWGLAQPPVLLCTLQTAHLWNPADPICNMSHMSIASLLYCRLQNCAEPDIILGMQGWCRCLQDDSVTISGIVLMTEDSKVLAKGPGLTRHRSLPLPGAVQALFAIGQDEAQAAQLDGHAGKAIKGAQEEAVRQANLWAGRSGPPGHPRAQGHRGRHAGLQAIFMEAVATPRPRIV